MAIKFNLNPKMIQIVADFIQRTDAYKGADANEYFTEEHNKAVQKVSDLEGTRHQFETIYELMLDNFIEVDNTPEKSSNMVQEIHQNEMLDDLKELIKKYE